MNLLRYLLQFSAQFRSLLLRRHAGRCYGPLATEEVGRGANFDPRRSENDQEIGQFAEREHGASEYQAECSADIAEQRQCRVGSFGLDVRVLQLREEHLRTTTENA